MTPELAAEPIDWASSDTIATKALDVRGDRVMITGDLRQPYFQSLDRWAELNGIFLDTIAGLPEDAICLDVGSNIGVTASLLSRRVRRGKVFAFEASPETSRFLQHNLEVNAPGNAVATQSAVSDSDGAISFRDVGNSAGAHVVTSNFPDATQSVQVKMVTLDTWADSQPDLGSVSFMKLDVEGFEPNVLAGAARLIARDRPLIHTELNSWCLNGFHNYSPAAFVKALMEVFEISMLRHDGTFGVVDSVLEALYVNLIVHGCASDLVLRLRPGRVVMPSLTQMVSAGPGIPKTW